jgi:segregation and condensation protein A
MTSPGLSLPRAESARVVPVPVRMATDAPIPIDPNFRLQLPNFEGPLDLLLHLVQTHSLDILDLPIAFVTEKYVEYLSMMQKLNLDVAAEYLVMAATLLHIKSKSLLPKPPPELEDDEDEEGDPREALIRRLFEYQKYKHAAEDLASRGLSGRDVFTRGTKTPVAEGEPALAPVSLFKLLDAFKSIAERVAGTLSLEVDAERITIQERMTQVIDLLEVRKRLRFEELFEGASSTYELVVTFLALLEMGKMRLLFIYQADPGSPIHIERQEGVAVELPDGDSLDTAENSGHEGQPDPIDEPES